jgi:hypothetical protein
MKLDAESHFVGLIPGFWLAPALAGLAGMTCSPRLLD